VTFEKIVEIASRKGCSPGQLSLAWVQHQGNDVSPIPGTTKVKNLEENIGALSVKITPDEMKEIENVLSTCGFSGDRMADALQGSHVDELRNTSSLFMEGCHMMIFNIILCK
jgi:diketogulonate reductase-like aldo/keto reductase